MRLFQRCIQHGVSLALYMAMVLPLHAQELHKCEPSSNKLALGGIALGAAAGAIAGFAAGHNKHNNRNTSKSCLCGDNNVCKPLKKKTLQFVITSSSVAGGLLYIQDSTFLASGVVNLNFFVINPEGCTTQGSTFEIPITGTIFATDGFNGTVTLPTNCCGAYQIGCLFDSPYPIYITSIKGFSIQVLINGNETDAIGLLTNNSELFSEDFDSPTIQTILAEFAFSPECCTVQSNSSEGGYG